MSHIFAAGQLVAERFHIVRFIAEGGMGEVYEAEDRVLGEHVALKFLNRRNIGDPHVAKRFRREIQLARKVTHPNVCRIFDVYQHRLTDGFLAGQEVTFVTMEMLAGETLEERLARDGPLSEAEALPLVTQMAAALAAAHDAGIVHRDFKSSNVMLVPVEGGGPRVVVTDFGLARAIGRSDAGTTPLTGEMKVLGTPDYMSPEQLHGRTASARSDLYALGVVLFELVTGDRPYAAESTMSLLVKRISDPPRSPRALVPELDERWERTILRCLAARPEDRFANAQAVAAALAEERPDERRIPPDGTLTAETLPAGVPPPARRPGWRSALGAGLLALLAFGLWQARGIVRPRPLLASFDPVQLTTGEGLELDPAFSPDGRQVVYSAELDGRFALYLRDLRPGGGERRLSAAGQAFEPAFSPGGDFIVYHDAERGGLWRIPSAGGEPARLTSFGSRPVFCPDAGTLAFQGDSQPSIAEATPAIGSSRIWLLDLASGEPRPLTSTGEPYGAHGSPACSPDGRRLVFTASQRGRSEIWSIGRDGEGLRAVVREPSIARDPVYAPDGRNLYFSAQARQVHGLWRVEIEPESGAPERSPEPIANLGLASIRQLAVAGDGRMAYAGLVTRSNLWALPLDPASGLPAGAPRALTTGGGRNNRPAFSPDGNLLAFDRWRLGVHADIWALPANGGEARQITTGPENDSIASWFPAADRVAFLRARDGERSLWSIRLANGEEERLAVLPADADWARLSPDGERVAYHARGEGAGVNLFVRELGRDRGRQLTFSDELAGFPIWSPDGGFLAYQLKQGGDSYVTLIAAAGGEPRQLTFEPGQSWPFAFSPDGRRIAFAGQREGRWELYWVARDGGETVRLTELAGPGRYLRYPAWSPRGESIVFELAETVGDVWLVESFP